MFEGCATCNLPLRECSCNSSLSRKDDQGKRRWSLLPWKEIREVVDILTTGAEKYDDFGWQEVIQGPQGRERYFDALHRHLDKYWSEEEEEDPSDGFSHLGHAICNILFLKWADRENNKPFPKIVSSNKDREDSIKVSDKDQPALNDLEEAEEVEEVKNSMSCNTCEFLSNERNCNNSEAIMFGTRMGELARCSKHQLLKQRKPFLKEITREEIEIWVKDDPLEVGEAIAAIWTDKAKLLSTDHPSEFPYFCDCYNFVMGLSTEQLSLLACQTFNVSLLEKKK